MDARISLLTLVVRDLERSRGFHVTGLGWVPKLDVPGEGAPPLTLAHNVESTGIVDAVLAAARDAGAQVTADPVLRDWGGYSGYFADPDGFRREVAYNPGPVGESLL